jgi:hypothetical protein
MPSSALAEYPTGHADLTAVARNVRLHVHRIDWSRVRCFEKRMFRAYRLRNIEDLPRPVVLYSHRPHVERVDTQIAVLTETWREPAAAISDEDLAREGFASRTEFKRYFAERYPKEGFRPLNQVQVFVIEPVTPATVEEWKDRAWESCYGRFAA